MRRVPCWRGIGRSARQTGVTPTELKGKFPKASIIDSSRVVFNIKGNDYRVVVRINYRYRVVYVRFVGTHAAYDRIDVREV